MKRIQSRKRVGKIVATEEFAMSEECIELFHAIQFIPLAVENTLYLGSVVFIGLSPRFDEVREGEVIPTVRLNVTTVDGKYKISVERL